MSQPPEYPGRKRLERMATRSAGGAYEGAFEAVGAILIATGLGYWFDQHFETEPAGLLVGAAIGFGAFVLRLFRLGRKLQADFEAQQAAGGVASAAGAKNATGDQEEEEGPGEGLGLSDVLDEDEGER